MSTNDSWTVTQQDELDALCLQRPDHDDDDGSSDDPILVQIRSLKALKRRLQFQQNIQADPDKTSSFQP